MPPGYRVLPGTKVLRRQSHTKSRRGDVSLFFFFCLILSGVHRFTSTGMQSLQYRFQSGDKQHHHLVSMQFFLSRSCRINAGGLLAVDVNMSIPGQTFHCTRWNVRPALRRTNTLGTSHSSVKKNFERSRHSPPLVTNSKVPCVPKRGLKGITLQLMREAPPLPSLSFHLVFAPAGAYVVVVA